MSVTLSYKFIDYEIKILSDCRPKTAFDGVFRAYQWQCFYLRGPAI